MNDNTFNGKTFQEEGTNIWEDPTVQETPEHVGQDQSVNIWDTEYETDRLSRIAASKNSKLDRLNQGASLQNTLTDMGDGWLESNSNKIWNELSGKEVQSLYEEVMSKALTTDETGRHFYSDGTEYEGSVRFAYMGGTKDESNDVVKFGLSRGDKDSAKARYDPDNGGWASGARGIDAENLDLDVLLPYDAATMLESVLHGRKEAIEGRVIKDLYNNPNERSEYGSGASEYYNNREALFGAKVDTDPELGKKLFTDFINKLPIRHSAYRENGSYDEVNTESEEFLRVKKNITDIIDSKPHSEIGQGISAIPASAAKGALDLADALLEAVTFLPQLAVRLSTSDDNYDIDVFNDGLKQSVIESVDRTVGYNRRIDDAKLQSAHEDIKSSGIDITSSDSIVDVFTDPEKLSKLGSATLKVITDPSLTISMVGEVFGSGLGLGAVTKAVGKASPKVLNVFKSNSDKIKAAVAEAAGDADKIAKLKASYTYGKRAADIIRGSVFTNADMAVRMNNDITTFKQNNDGNAPDNLKLFEMAVLNRIVSNAEIFTLKSIAGIKSPSTEVLKDVAKKGILNATGVVVGKALKGGAFEGVQETVDSVVEQLNQKVGSSDWEGKSVHEILSAASSDILTGTIAGASSGIHISGGSALVSEGIPGVASTTGALLSKVKLPERKVLDQPSVDKEPITVDEVKSAKQEYGTLLHEVKTYINKTGVTENNIGVLLEDIGKLNDRKHIISTSPKSQQDAGEAEYSNIVKSVEEFIEKNPTLKLTKRKIRKSIKDSVDENEVIKSVPEDVRTAFTTLAGSLGTGEVSSDKAAITTIINKFKKGGISDVFPEKGTLDKELVALEQAITGKTSETIEESFDNVQTALRGKTSRNFFKNPKGKVLGSSPDTNESVSEEFEEVDYDDYTRKIDAENAMRIVLGSGNSYSKSFKLKAATFGKANGISTSEVNEIIKSYESVEEEATYGNRGYKSRLSRLRSLASASNPDTAAIDREFKGLTKFQSSLVNSETNLRRGIVKAVAKAKELNKSNISNKDTYQVKTDYMKYNKSSGLYDVPYLINVKRKDGVWTADVTREKELLVTKTSYIEGINEGLREIGGNFESSGVSAPIGNIVIPIKEDKKKASRQSEINYVSKVDSVVSEILPESKGVNKVILGKTTGDNWKVGSDHRKANASIINTGNYSENDVVVVDIRDVKNNKGNKGVTAKLDPATKKELSKAIKAGATIVLDSDFVKGLGAKKNRKYKTALTTLIKSNDGYIELDSDNKNIFILKSASNQKAVRAKKEKEKEAKLSESLIKRYKTRMVNLSRALNLGLDTRTGEKAEPERKEAMEKEFAKARTHVLKHSFGGDNAKLERFLERETVDAVSKAAEEILTSQNPVPVDYADKVFKQAVEDYVVQEDAKDSVGDDILESWSEVSQKGLNSAKRDKGIIESLKGTGLVVKSLITDIIEKRTFAKGKADLYELIYEHVATGEQTVVPRAKHLSKEEFDSLVAKNDEHNAHVIRGKKSIFLGGRRVVQDFTKIVEVNKTTVVNTIPLDYMPFYVRSRVNAFSSSVSKALMKLQPSESDKGTFGRGSDGKPLEGGFNLHNSPARGLLYDKDGNVNEEVASAIYLAIGDAVLKDKTAMSRGYKPDSDVADMFNVQETDVTEEMREFSKENGMLLKTAANKIGKSILGNLGLGKKIDSDTSASEYEAFISDLGNNAILIAEDIGLFSNTSVKSDKLAKFYSDSEARNIDSDTHFIHITDEVETFGKFSKNVATEEVVEFSEEFEAAMANMPEISTTKKAPYFEAPDDTRLDKAMNEVRNDIAGKQVPSDAKTTLEYQMNTPYSPDIEAITEILDAVDAEGSKVKGLLGFVPIGSKEFEDLYYKDKEVQEAKNNAIDKTFDELRDLKKRIEEHGDSDTKLYFDFFYSGNDRYMLDSNTINPQVDKLHRFLIVPSAHKLDYDVSVEDGGVRFNVGTGVDKDQSFTVRMAIAQAMGQGIDKMKGRDIIDFSNVMLGLNKEQLKEVRKAVLDRGSLEVSNNGNNYKIEAEHLSHTLQAIKFLEGVQDAIDGNGKMSSSLSLEFDSLTSGFANKIQQMPILKNMHEHFARTGILTVEYQRRLAEAINFKGAGIGFDIKAGDTIADLIASGNEDVPESATENTKDAFEFLDSYKTMAKNTIILLQDGSIQKRNLTQSIRKGMLSGNSVYEAIKPMLPGGESIASVDSKIVITSAIRNLFKDPFMIFNYSASISRIVKNLSLNVANDIAKSIATSDLSLDKNSGVVAVASNMITTLKLVDPETDLRINTVKELQEVLKNNRLSAIKLETPFYVNNKKKGERYKQAENLEEALTKTVGSTYGEAVANVFAESFAEFIEVQDAMNDTFKLSFRIFDKKRIDMLKKLQETKADRFLSVEDHASVLEKLWDDFPWIVGPLTGSDDKKSVIAVVTTATRSPRSVEVSRKKPQAVLNGKGNKTRTVTPLVKYLEEAISAGSVLPFHAIDGAEIARTFIAMGIEGIAAIHDAVIPPLNMSDKVGFNYVKSMNNINTTYVLADALSNLLDRVNATVEQEGFNKEYKDLSVEGFKSASKDSKETFGTVAKVITGRMKASVDLITKERKKWYGKDGLLAGALHGNLVGTAGAMYKDGDSEPDLSYKEAFKPFYVETNPEVVAKESSVDDSKFDTETISGSFVNFTENSLIRKRLANFINKEVADGSEVNENTDYIAGVLLENPKVTDKAIAYFNKLINGQTTEKNLEDLKSLVDNLKLFVNNDEEVDVEINDNVDEEVSVEDDRKNTVLAIESKTKNCKGK